MTSGLAGRLHTFFSALCLVLAGVQAWQSRHGMNGDGIAYLDMASAYLAGDWQTAANAYWPPLYSLVLAAGLGVLRPSGAWEYPAVHLVNLGIFAATLASFRFFLSACLAAWRPGEEETGSEPLPETGILVLGYLLFACTSLLMAPIQLVSPDLSVAAVTYLAAGLLLRIHREKERQRLYLALGAVLGLGYLAKTVFLVLGPLFLVVCWLAVGVRRVRLPLVAAGMLGIVVAAHVGWVSLKKGRLVIGEIGRLNYAFAVRDPGTVLHEEPEVWSHPRVEVFEASPAWVTHAGRYDPADHYREIRFRFHPEAQWRVIRKSLRDYRKLLSSRWQVGIAMLAGVVLWLERGRRRLRERLILLAPAAGCFALYALVHVNARYLPGFVVSAWMGLILGARVGRGQGAAVTALAGMAWLAAAPEIVAACRRSVPDQHWPAAAELLQAGLRRGDRVAMIGGTSVDLSWARLLRARVVAHVPYHEAAQYWSAPAERRDQVRKTMAEVGARAVVTVSEKDPAEPGWRRAPDTSYWYRMLP